VSADIGCHLFSILPPFNLGATTMGYGLGGASAAALNAPASKRAISVMGDGGFWHNGLTSGIANAVFNKSDNLTIVVDNSYTSATGGQDILSSTALNPTRSTGHEIEQAVRGVGVKWVRTVRRTYDLKAMMATLRRAHDRRERAEGADRAERMHAEQAASRETEAAQGDSGGRARGARALRRRFGYLYRRSFVHPAVGLPVAVDQAQAAILCAPIRSRACSIAARAAACAARSVAAVLCPSFYRAQIISNPTKVDRLRQRLRNAVIGWLQRREAQRRARYAFDSAF
jgi:indolepyruvate ferredoxin oxidoreductase alpha subunit